MSTNKVTDMLPGPQSYTSDQHGWVSVLRMQGEDPQTVFLPMTVLVPSLPQCIFYFPTPFCLFLISLPPLILL